MSDKCYVCGGQFDPRFIDKPCPKCGRQYNKPSVEKMKINTEKADTVLIPKQYIGVEWSGDVLAEDKRNIKDQLGLKELIRNMTAIHDFFKKGVLPTRSAIIIASPRFSKITWAYSCMQHALNNGLTVAPLLDTVELKRFMLLAAEKPYHKIYDMIDYESYITAETCFITVTKSSRFCEAYNIILDILDIRSRKGLPTYIISRFPLKALAKWDTNNHFEALRGDFYKEDTYKYPAICCCLEEVRYG